MTFKNEFPMWKYFESDRTGNETRYKKIKIDCHGGLDVYIFHPLSESLKV